MTSAGPAEGFDASGGACATLKVLVQKQPSSTAIKSVLRFTNFSLR